MAVSLEKRVLREYTPVHLITEEESMQQAVSQRQAAVPDALLKSVPDVMPSNEVSEVAPQNELEKYIAAGNTLVDPKSLSKKQPQRSQLFSAETILSIFVALVVIVLGYFWDDIIRAAIEISAVDLSQFLGFGKYMMAGGMLVNTCNMIRLTIKLIHRS